MDRADVYQEGITPSVCRLYDVFPIVEMEYQRREEAYATLGGYFDGDNESSTRYKYTQPVVMRYDPNVSQAREPGWVCGVFTS